MLPVKLGNATALRLTNALLNEEINNKINSTYNVDIEHKRYHFLDKTRATELKQKEHSFVLNTFGAKYLLFLTHINFKPYAVYINRKNNTFFLVKIRFSLDLYNDTILEGESIKVEEKWFFLISDCLVHKGEILMTQNYSTRYKIISEILEKHYVADSYLEPFTLLKKDIFEYKDLIAVKEKYIEKLPFQVNGYVFKCENNASYDILYIFPEFRNKQKSEVESQSSPDKRNSSPDKRNSSPDMRINSVDIRRNSVDNRRNSEDRTSSPDKRKISPVKNDTTSLQCEEKNEATFLMKKTEFPDVYEIYIFDKNKGKRARVGYAGIPTIKTSAMVREWFTDREELYAKFKKNQINDKWIPQFIVSTEVS